jgi:hypothetical protein
MRKAHRVAWELTYGAIPDGMCVCHACDNRACCNPEHLWLGTRTDNNRDCDAKHRRIQLVGEQHPRSKLTVDAVVQMRRRYTGKRGELTLFAKEFGVSKSTVFDVIKGDIWKAV